MAKTTQDRARSRLTRAAREHDARVARAEAMLIDAVRDARTAGLSWDHVAEALGEATTGRPFSRQAVHERFAAKVR